MTICISGASGLVGNEILIQVLNDPGTEKVLVLARNPLGFGHPKMQVVIVPFDQLDQLEVAEKIDVAFCALGTTLRKAGSKARQQEIDRDYVISFGKFCKKAGAEKIGIVSSIGANAASSNFYLRTKGEMEQGISQLGIPTTVFIRPSFLIGPRKEKSFGDKLIQGISLVISPFLIGKTRKYRGIHGSKVAQKLIRATLTEPTGIHYLEIQDNN
ncbi:NAD(P)H-binding protein [Fluviicola chungangensis]|uniref:Oxidoreductase n=1 Tax=Fluviicola chungangensis TaxID=2597671 RepID=A0A556MIW3_9FLAO|nr:NAD(P)H-binding protein [Fluviicola chungangensis]TSJ39803.1 oxidoreductase [Fluviicola chungangensis]